MKCPFCDGTLGIGAAGDQPAPTHSEPPCATFAGAAPAEFLLRVKVAVIDQGLQYAKELMATLSDRLPTAATDAAPPPPRTGSGSASPPRR